MLTSKLPKAGKGGLGGTPPSLFLNIFFFFPFLFSPKGELEGGLSLKGGGGSGEGIFPLPCRKENPAAKAGFNQNKSHRGGFRGVTYHISSPRGGARGG